MKKRKQTCSTKHIPCAKVKIFFSLQKLYFTASIAAIVCCLGKNPRKKIFSRNILATFSNSEKCKKWCLGQKEWKQALLALWPLFGHFGHIERSIWTYCSSIQTYCSCFWTCWPPPIAVIFCQEKVPAKKYLLCSPGDVHHQQLQKFSVSRGKFYLTRN